MWTSTYYYITYTVLNTCQTVVLLITIEKDFIIVWGGGGIQCCWTDLSGGLGELFLDQLDKLPAIVLSLLGSLEHWPIEVLQSQLPVGAERGGRERGGRECVKKEERERGEGRGSGRVEKWKRKEEWVGLKVRERVNFPAFH
jgi:hypothetical protein